MNIWGQAIKCDSAMQRDSQATGETKGMIPTNSCYDCGFRKQTIAKIGAILRHHDRFGTEHEQCRIYALFTNNGVSMIC